MSDRCLPRAFSPPTVEKDGRDAAAGPRIALYSHDAMGIGHLRRNLLIAHTFVRASPGATVLLVSGTRESGAFPVVPGVDCLTLPALEKRGDGTYGSRSLALRSEELRRLRSRTLRVALAAFRPDVLIVDKLPRGVLGELDDTLAELRSAGGTRMVLGLRDILDAPPAIRLEWARADNEEAIARYYDGVWVYGDPAVYDPVREYDFGPAVARKLVFTGYLDPRLGICLDPRLATDGPEERREDGFRGPTSPRLLLCQVGGGQDGDRLAEAFARAEFPPGTEGAILTGPFMPALARRRLQHLAAARGDLRLVGFTSRPETLLRAADRVVAMGGYNTVCEALSHRKPTLVVPRVRPRMEQLIRAERFSALRLLEALHPDRLRPEALTEWLHRDLSTPPDVRESMDFEGLQRLPRLLDELLAGGPVRGLSRREGTPEGERVGPPAERMGVSAEDAGPPAADAGRSPERAASAAGNLGIPTEDAGSPDAAGLAGPRSRRAAARAGLEVTHAG